METPQGHKRKGLVCACEFLGQIFFMYAVMVSGATKSDFAGLVGPLALFSVASIFGGISGGHFNPAVTLGVYIREGHYAKNFLFMVMIIASQVSGALVGMMLGYMVLRIDVDGTLIVPKQSVPLLLPSCITTDDIDNNTIKYGEEFTTFYMEVICTFVFVLFILFVSGKHGGGSVWGLPAICIVLWALCSVDFYTGASFNPALAIAQSVFQAWWYPTNHSNVMYHYLPHYVGGALTGGLISGAFYNIYEKHVLDVMALER